MKKYYENPQEFEGYKKKRVNFIANDQPFIETANDFLNKNFHNQYSYNFNWFGIPIIQLPEDVINLQEIIFKVKPDVIIETGIARGGSLIFYSSILKLINKKKVIGIDNLILDFNKKSIEEHFLSDMVELVIGDSVSSSTLKKVESLISSDDTVLVCLDSNHSESHVLKELDSYSSFVSVGSYIIVFDSTIEKFKSDEINVLKNQYHIEDWGKGNNPGSAVRKFLSQNNNFVLDEFFNDKSVLSNLRGGILKKVK